VATDQRPIGDGALWRAAANGDDEAFAVLYERYADRVHSYCFRRSGSWAHAQDLTSVVFLEAWRRRREVIVDESGSVAGWLFGVANNVIRNGQRSLRRHGAALRRLPSPEPEPDFADRAADRVDDESRMRRVLSAMERLSPAEQEVLALCVWSDLSRAQVAAALGVQVGTVKSRLARAREHLRTLSATEDDEPREPVRQVAIRQEERR
jgi:RNA polymerase sigma factor (sigma-70 family)